MRCLCLALLFCCFYSTVQSVENVADSNSHALDVPKCDYSDTSWQFCNGRKCYHGDCIPVGNGRVTCRCHPGWTIDNGQCNTCCDRPCQHGYCIAKSNGDPYCQCDGGYQGDYCNETVVMTTTAVPIVTDDNASFMKIWEYVLIIFGSTIVVLLLICAAMLFYIWYYQTLTWEKFVHTFKDYEDDPSRYFDGFIAYRGGSGDDSDFVHNELLEKLRGENMNFKICIDSEHFIAGDDITNNIIRAIQNSKRTILVISPDFLSSSWTKLEYQTAQKEMLELHHRIIPVIFKDVDIDNLKRKDRGLKFILDTITYIKWPDSDFWDKLKLSMPKLKKRGPMLDKEQEFEVFRNDPQNKPKDEPPHTPLLEKPEIYVPVLPELPCHIPEVNEKQHSVQSSISINAQNKENCMVELELQQTKCISMC